MLSLFIPVASVNSGEVAVAEIKVLIPTWRGRCGVLWGAEGLRDEAWGAGGVEGREGDQCPFGVFNVRWGIAFQASGEENCM